MKELVVVGEKIIIQTEPTRGMDVESDRWGW